MSRAFTIALIFLSLSFVAAQDIPRTDQKQRSAVSANDQILFQDDFKGKVQKEWSWVREKPKAWRITAEGLQIHVEPGNMWGPQNNAKNILIRNAPDPAKHTLEISAIVSNRPTHQYEQVNLVWYYDDSHMVKLGQELVDGQLSVVMGREEKDRTRTIAIVPIDLERVEVRFTVTANKIRGEFRSPGTAAWREAGECDLPAHGIPKISLQCYQGPSNVEHWATITDFEIRVR